MKKEKDMKRKYKRKTKKAKRQVDKTYRTNPDTISLNCDEFCPGWMREK